MTPPRRGGKDILALVAAGVGVQLLTVVSGPLVARMLGPQGRGEMVMVTVLTLLCSQLAAGGLPVAVAHTVASAHAAARDVLRGQLLRWGLLAGLPAGLAAVLTFVALHDAQARTALVAIAFAITLMTTWQLVLAGMLQGEGDVRRVNTQRIVGTLAYVGGVTSIFVLHRTDQAAVLLTVYFVAQVVALVIGWLLLKRPTRDPSLEASREQVGGLARRSFLSNVGALDGLGVDHLVVGLVLGQSALGLYAVAVSVTNLPTIVLGGLAAMLLPRMAARGGAEGIALMRRWVLAAIGVGVALAVGLEAVIAPVLRIVFGQEFVPATGCARILIVAWCLLAMRRVLTAAAQAQGRAGRASAIEAVAFVVLVAAVLVGGNLRGIEGAAFGMALAGAVSCTLLALSLRWRPVEGEDSRAVDVDVEDVLAIDEGDLRLP